MMMKMFDMELYKELYTYNYSACKDNIPISLYKKALIRRITLW